MINGHTNPTPREMLKLYRDGSDEFTIDQVNKFQLLPASDRMEILLYMFFHMSAAIQMIHAKLEPEAAKTQGMPDTGKPN